MASVNTIINKNKHFEVKTKPITEKLKEKNCSGVFF